MAWILNQVARIWWQFEGLKNKEKWVRTILRDGRPLIVRYYIFNTRWIEDYQFLKKHFGYLSMNLVIHQMFESDDDGLHDHPWPWASWVIATGYHENTPNGRFWRFPGHLRFRPATAFHRLELDPTHEPGSCWTLFLMGQRQREWGFLQDDGSWVPWYNHTDKVREIQHA